MTIVKSSLTIIFDPPFYKAIFERRFDSSYEVGQVNLGTSEPKLTLIYDLIIHHWEKINFFQQKAGNLAFLERKINPKRLQRLATQSINQGMSTKAQRALQKQLENQKVMRKQSERTKKAYDQEKKYKLHQAKKIQKHKGH